LNPKRIIGQYEGATTDEFRTLFIVFGSIHGNEPAGVRALQRLFRALEASLEGNFRGRIVGLWGNLAASAQGVRYLERDLNRLFSFAEIERVRAIAPPLRQAEDRELAELLDCIETQIQNFRPTALVFLDLHTTSAQNGIFAIPPDADTESDALAQRLHVPVVRRLTEGIGGTVLHYFNASNMGIPTRCIGLEAGQHDDPQSVNHALAVVVEALEAVGCLSVCSLPDFAALRQVLRDETRSLPRVVELSYVHPIMAADGFVMLPNFQNFQSVVRGQLLAHDRHGAVVSPQDALILMPLYQAKGNDGFFLVRVGGGEL
jgi:succinylglutamate desuccinylase